VPRVAKETYPSRRENVVVPPQALGPGRLAIQPQGEEDGRDGGEGPNDGVQLGAVVVVREGGEHLGRHRRRTPTRRGRRPRGRGVGLARKEDGHDGPALLRENVTETKIPGGGVVAGPLYPLPRGPSRNGTARPKLNRYLVTGSPVQRGGGQRDRAACTLDAPAAMQRCTQGARSGIFTECSNQRARQNSKPGYWSAVWTQRGAPGSGQPLGGWYGAGSSPPEAIRGPLEQISAWPPLRSTIVCCSDTKGHCLAGSLGDPNTVATVPRRTLQVQYLGIMSSVL